MPREYQTFVSKPEILKEGREMKLVIKDLTPGPRKYNCRVVKAVVSKDLISSPGSDLLWLRSLSGRKFPDPWSIRIIEELGDSIKTKPYQAGVEVITLLNEDLT